MKYRSYNSELLISTTLVVNVFNDIIIDRRKHGLNADYSKAITLGDIVQQTIEVPCILGDRAPILKSLENEPGKYKMPLIILQMKGIKTDTARMLDLHSDIFYQQDDSFSQLDYNNPMYRPKELSKMRAQPINISYDATFITKYREDLDQIISNFVVHFRPDIYLKWFHPRRKNKPLVSQLNWSHDISYDPMIEYNPQNVFTYKGTTSFTFKSWLFYGMHATDNRIDPELESIIKTIKIFPDRSDNGEDTSIYKDDDVWVFGNILNTPNGQQELKNDKSGFGFYGVDQDQDFVGNDEEQMKNGQFVVNNVFAEEYAPISGNPVFQQIHKNSNTADIYTTYDRLNNYGKNQYQMYLELDANNKNETAQFKNVFFKGSFPQSAFLSNSPSGDFVFKRFFKSYVDNKKAKSIFGDSFVTESQLNVNYDIDTKDFVLWAEYDDKDVHIYGKTKFNSQNGHYQEFSLESKPIDVHHLDQVIKYSFHREYDKDLNHLPENDVLEKVNIRPIGDYVSAFETKLIIEDTDIKNESIKILNCVKSFWSAINLQENAYGGYDMIIEDIKVNDYLLKKGIKDVPFRSFNMLSQTYKDGNYYQILCNRRLYIVLKYNEKTPDDIDIYDIGLLVQMKFASHYALIYEVLIPESRELLGLNFRLGI